MIDIRKTFMATAVMLLAAITLNASMKTADRKTDTDIQGHVLTSLWKRYDSARKSDLPRQQQEVLLKIIGQAREERLGWDYYDAWRKYVSVSASRDWKLREGLMQECSDAFLEYGDPLLTYAWRSEQHDWSGGSRLPFIRENEALLKSSRSEGFITGCGNPPSMMKGHLPEYIRNDYEYALWDYLGNGRPDKEAADLLRAELKGSYPASAYLDLLEAEALDLEGRKAALEKVKADNEGNAIGLMAWARLLTDRRWALEATGTAAGFEALYDEAREFEKRRWAVRGRDATLARSITEISHLLKQLTDKEMSLEVEDGEICLYLRNLPSVNLSIFKEKGKTALERMTLENPRRSFHVQDTVRVAFPDLDDGTYRIRASNRRVSRETILSKHSLSLAGRRDRDAYRIYLAWQDSGRPVRKADLVLSRNGKEVSVVRDFGFGEGFTQLPPEISSFVSGKGRCTMECRFVDEKGVLRSSGLLYTDGNPSYGTSGSRSGVYGRLYTDRMAYRPGETVHFNALFYEGDLSRKLSTACHGKPAKAVLIDTQGNEVDVRELTVNDFGTAASSFELPRGKRNGWFSIVVTAAGISTSRSIRVDDFELPDTELEFDGDQGWFKPGDLVRLGGTLRSYTGHSTSSSRMEYRIEYRGDTLCSGPLTQDGDGRFSIEFPSESGVSHQYYRVTVKVTDGNGKTQEYGRSIYLSDEFRLELSMLDKVSARYEKLDADWRSAYGAVTDSDLVKFRFDAESFGGASLEPVVDYQLFDKDGKEVCTGRCPKEGTLSLDLSAYSGSMFTLKARGRLRGAEAEAELEFVRVRPGDGSLDAPLENYFRALSEELEPGEDMRLQIGAAGGPVWAVIGLFGNDRRLLSSSLLHLEGRTGEEGSLTTVTLPYPEEYPDAVRAQVFYFRKGGSHSFDVQFSRRRHDSDLPLEWSRLVDRTVPGGRVTLEMKTLPDVELMATVYDLSIDRICADEWTPIRLSPLRLPAVDVNSVTGGIRTDMPVVAYGRPVRMRSKGLVLNEVSASYDMAEADGALAGDVMEDSAASGAVFREPSPEGAGEVRVREDFAGTLAFEPSLRSGADGLVSMSFDAGDRLSTYKMMVLAHTRDMKNSVLKGQMLISLPLKLDFNPPAYVHVGDRPAFSVTLSSSADELLCGTLFLYEYAGARGGHAGAPGGNAGARDGHAGALSGNAGAAQEDAQPLTVLSRKVEIPAGSSVSCVLDPGAFDEEGERGFKLVFVADGKDGFSDAMFVKIPVLSDEQILTESHSALMRDPSERDGLVAALESAFVNTSSHGARLRELSVRDMIGESFSAHALPSVPDVLSLSEALYVNVLAGKLGMEVSQEQAVPVSGLLEDMLACQNADGGFSWFAGMESSPVLTAAVLERMAKLRRHAALEFDPRSAVAYLDRAYFADPRPYWRGGMTMEQYLYVRSAYSEVPFEYAPVGEKAKERFSAFGREATDYLLPEEERGLSGQILAKARRLRTLAWLSADGAGDLVSALGIRRSSRGRLGASLDKDLRSLLEYAVEHRDGGIYYPDAVMPFRGLLESEAYAHSLLCDLFDDYAKGALCGASDGLRGRAAADGLGRKADADGLGGRAASDGLRGEAARVAEGIRLWLMVQKETQHWDADPAYLDAVNSVLSGDVLDVRVLVMSKSYQKPYSQIKPSGNGFRVERKFFRDGKELTGGEVLKLGDKLTAEYRVWNAENRSFVRLRACREAAFRPVDQLSGLSLWGVFRTPSWPLSFGGCYRNVLADATEYYFDSYPEEDTVITEEFYVTQEGNFSCPVLEIECLYAPHYRANGGFGGIVTSRW